MKNMFGNINTAGRIRSRGLSPLPKIHTDLVLSDAR
jgi:hypothetical protein